jgi:hypothetical protein
MPAKCPELDAQENVWQFVREYWLSNRIFKSDDQSSDAWNTLVDQPSRIMFIGNWDPNRR